MTRALRRWIRGWVPACWRLRRTVRVPVVADLDDTARLWSLEVRRSRRGPGRLVADPRMELQPDEAFSDAVADAYAWAWAREFFPRDEKHPWTITWCLFDADGLPASGKVRGGSLGAALGVALAYLFGLGRQARRRIDPDAVVSARLDEYGRLAPVSGLDTKVRTLGMHRARLLVATSDEVTALDVRAGEHPVIVSGTKAVDAIKFAAARRHWTVPATAIALVMVAAVLTWIGVQQVAAREAEQERLVQQLSARSRQSLPTEPAVAALAATAAARLDPGNHDAQAALFNAATVDNRFAGVLAEGVTAIALNPDGTTLATGGDEHAVSLTRTDRTGQVRSARAGGGSVAAMVFAPDGHTLYTVDSRGALVRWDTTTTLSPTVVTQLGAGSVTALAVNPDGTQLALATQGNRVRVVNTLTSAVLDLSSQRSTVTSLVFTAPTTLLVGVIGRSIADQLLAYDIAHANQPPRVVLTAKPRAFIRGVTALAVSANGRTLLSGSITGEVVLWDVASLAQRKTVDVKDAVLGLVSDTNADNALVTTARGLGISTEIDRGTSDATTQLWDLSQTEARSAPLNGTFRTATVVAATTLQIAVVRGVNGSATLWTDLDGAPMRQDGLVSDIVPDPLAPAAVLTAGAGGRIDFVDVAVGQTVRSLPAQGHDTLFGLAVSPSGQAIATAHGDGAVLLRDRNTGAVLHELKTSAKPVYRVAFSPSGHLLAAGGGDGTVRLWDTATGLLTKQWTTNANVIHQVLFDATGQRVYVAESRFNGVVLRGGLWWASVDSDTIHDQQDLQFPARGMTNLPGNRVLVGDSDGTLRVTDDHLLPLPQSVPFRHRLNVYSLAYSPRSNRVVTGAGDNTSAVLQSDNLTLLLQLPTAEAIPTTDSASTGIYSVAVTTDGRYAVAGGHAGRIQVVPLDASLLIDRACRLAGRQATAADLRITDQTLAEMGAPC